MESLISPSGAHKPTVVIAEDEFLIRDGYMTPLLSPHFEIVAAVGDGIEAVEAVEKHRPQVVLLDVSLPRMRGFDAARLIMNNRPETRVLIVSNYERAEYVQAAVELGASGYVVKSRIASELVTAIREALEGRFYRSIV